MKSKKCQENGAKGKKRQETAVKPEKCCQEEKVCQTPRARDVKGKPDQEKVEASRERMSRERDIPGGRHPNKGGAQRIAKRKGCQEKRPQERQPGGLASFL